MTRPIVLPAFALATLIGAGEVTAQTTVPETFPDVPIHGGG